MKVNKIFTQLATRCAGACCRSAFSGVSQARSALLASAPCAKYSVFWRSLSSFSLWIIFLPPSLPSPPWCHCLGGSWLEDAVYQPWGRNSVQGLALPTAQAPGHPQHPPPLSNAVINVRIEFIQSSKFVVPGLPSVLFPVLLLFHIAALNVSQFECDFQLDVFSNSCFRLSLSKFEFEFEFEVEWAP